MRVDRGVQSIISRISQANRRVEAMLRMLDLSSGVFSLSISVCNSPALRNYLIEKMRKTRPDIQVICIPRDTADVLTYVRQQVNTPDCSALFITGLEELLPSTQARHPVLRSINASRELWERQFHCPIVVWLPEYAAGLLSREAPDFWRYRSHRFEFVSEYAHAFAGMQENTSDRINTASNLPVDEKQFRIAELEQRIEEAGPKPDGSVRQFVMAWLNEMAFLKQSLGQFDAAEETVRKSLALHRQLGDKTGIAQDYSLLGELYLRRGDFKTAEQMARKSLALYEELGDMAGMALDYRLLGEGYRERGDIEIAEQMLRKSLSLYQKLGDRDGMAVDYRRLGLLYRERGDVVTAEQMLRESLALSEELGDKTGMASDYMILGLLYRERGDVETSEQMLRKSLTLHEELGDNTGMAYDYRLLGMLYLDKGDVEAGMSELRRSQQLFRELGAAELEDLERILSAAED